MPSTLTLRPVPSSSDPFVVAITALIAFVALLLVVTSTSDARERVVRLVFLYLTYCAFEVVVKRLAHFVWFLYPIKFGLLFSVLFYWAQLRQQRSRRLTPFVGVLGAYLAVAALQIFNPYQGNPIVGVLGWLTDFIFAFFYFVAFDVFDNVVTMRRFLRFTAILGILSAIVCFAEQLIGPETLMRAYPTYVHLVFFERSGGVVYRPSSLSAYLEIFGIAAMLGLLADRRWRLMFVVAGILACAIANVLHAVRIVWMTGIAIFGLLSIFNRRRRLLSVALIAGSVALAVNIGLSATEGQISQSLRSAASPIATFEQTRLWGLLALPTIVANFPLGIGVGESSPGVRFLDAGDVINFGAHNYLTELAGQMSLLGPILLVMFSAGVLLTGARFIWRAKPGEWRTQVATGLSIVGALAASFLVGGGLGSYPVSDYFWLMAGATMGLVYSQSRRVQTLTPQGPRVHDLPSPRPVLLSRRSAGVRRSAG
jgi:hypothetical protein